MKQSSGNWLTVAGFLVVVGMLIFIGVMSVKNWNFSGLWNAGYKTETYVINDEFRNISIDTDTEAIVFLPSDDGKCRAEVYENSKVKHTVQVKDGTLFIGRDDTRKWYERVTFFGASPKITLYLPESEYAVLTVKEATGDVSLPGDFTFESIDISLSTGDVSCSASSTGLIRIKTSTGDIVMEKITAGELDLTVTTGKADVRSAVIDGDLGISVSTGKTVLTDVSCGSLNTDGSTGDVSMENVIAADTMTIQRSTGKVKFEKCDAAELLIKTDTGSVTGSLLSEKIFIARSSSGSIHVPETTTGGKCSVTTTTGDIRITVE